MAGIASLASNLAAKGRKGDNQLLHVSSDELKGLHALAASRGLKMTRNPETGLYEAGWLKSLLPTIAGGAAMMVPGMQPWGAALIGAGVGGLTGSKKNGFLMNAGLGALGGWGGASLFNAFAAAGLP